MNNNEPKATAYPAGDNKYDVWDHRTDKLDSSHKTQRAADKAAEKINKKS